MQANPIKNVVFDIGNVIVRWSPNEIIRLTFGDLDSSESLATSIFQSEIWMELNKGRLTELEAGAKFQHELGLTSQDTERLFYYVKQTQILLFGSIELMKRVKKAGYQVYALTDNVVEIVAYLKSTYSFWPLFDGAIVSADVDYLKPQPEIYQQLLEQYDIQPSESVFIDDMLHNVRGAESLGFSAIQFKNAAQCEKELLLLGLSF